MADRRNRGQIGNPTGGVGAPGTTGAFKTSDPLGAPGSTGAGLTHQDPTAIPSTGGAAYEDPNVDFNTGGQQQQHRHPTSVGFEDLDEFGRTRVLKGDTGFNTRDTGDFGRSQVGSDQTGATRFDTSGDMGDVGRRRAEPGLTGDTGFDSSKFGSGETGGFDQSRVQEGPVGVTGFTRITTTTAPGGAVVYGRETVAEAEDLGATGTGTRAAEKAKEMKDRVQGGHSC